MTAKHTYSSKTAARGIFEIEVNQGLKYYLPFTVAFLPEPEHQSRARYGPDVLLFGNVGMRFHILLMLGNFDHLIVRPVNKNV